jgi:hypothetical protein
MKIFFLWTLVTPSFLLLIFLLFLRSLTRFLDFAIFVALRSVYGLLIFPSFFPHPNSALSNPFCRFSRFLPPQHQDLFPLIPLFCDSRVLVIEQKASWKFNRGWQAGVRPHMCVYSSHAILKIHFGTAAAALCTDAIRMNL